MLVDPDVALLKFPSVLVEKEAQAPLVSKSVQLKLPLIGVTGSVPPPPPFPVVLPPFPLPLPPFPLPPPPFPPVLVATGLTPAHPNPAATPNDKVTTDNRLDEVCKRIGWLRRLGTAAGGVATPRPA
jgi:hypothetical protein